MLLRNDVPGIVYSFLLTAILTASALAQVDRGAIVGTVTDQAGARVADALVTVTNLEANQSTSTNTNAEGNFTVNLLRIGTYSVRV